MKEHFEFEEDIGLILKLKGKRIGIRII